MSTTIQRETPKILLTVTGLIVLLNGFFDIPLLRTWTGELTAWTTIIAAVSIWLGAVYASYANYRLYQRNRNKGKEHLVYFIAPFLFFILQFGAGVLYGTDSPQYLWYFNHIYANIGAAVYAVMFFTLLSSAYRTFIVSSWDATALLLGGVLYTLRQVPIFQTWYPPIIDIGEWVMLVPNVGGGRGAVIAAALGALAVGIRTLLCKETTVSEAGK